MTVTWFMWSAIGHFANLLFVRAPDGSSHRALIDFMFFKERKIAMKRILTLTLAVLTVFSLLLMLSACGSKVDPAKDKETIQEKGVLKVGMECAYAPYNWTQVDDSNGAVKIANADGYANGYDVQIAQKLADALGVKLEIYAYEFGALLSAVQSGALDCIAAGMSPTDIRKETVDFTSNYWISNLVVITKKDGTLASASSLSDLAGKTIGAQVGTFHADALSQIANVQSKIMDDFTVLYTALNAGTIDGYVAEEPTAYSICAANNTLMYVPLVNNSTGFTCSDGDAAIAVGVRKGSNLTAEFNRVIDAMTDTERSDLMQKMVAASPIEE